MKLRNLISVIMNRSEFAGYNWLNVSLALPILIGMIYIGYLASVSENGLVAVLIGIAIFFLDNCLHNVVSKSNNVVGFGYPHRERR